MSSINFVGVSGRLGRDPEMRYLPNGKAICSLNMAVDDGWGDKKTTYWFPVTAFGQTAEFCGKHLAKGSSVFIQGKLQNRSFTAKDGTIKEVTSIVADKVVFVGGKAPDAAQDERQAKPKPTDQERYERQEAKAQHENRGVLPGDMADDVPW